MTTPDQTPDPDAVLDAAVLDAACAQLPAGVPRYRVEAALKAAQAVVSAAETADLDALMDQTGLASLGRDGRDLMIRIVPAMALSAHLVKGFEQFLAAKGDPENYIECQYTTTDPARQQAILDGAPFAEVPAEQVYLLTVVRPGRPSPHQLRRDAEARINRVLDMLREDGGPLVAVDAVRSLLQQPAVCTADRVSGQGGGVDVLRYVADAPEYNTTLPGCNSADQVAAALALVGSGRPLLDPREVAAALGRPAPCTSPAGDCDTDFDPDCPRHSTAHLTEKELLALLPAARQGAKWAKGAWASVLAEAPHRTPQDWQLANITAALVQDLRTPAVQEGSSR